jgi:Holliday junction resolvase RusA-like endonuclease
MKKKTRSEIGTFGFEEKGNNIGSLPNILLCHEEKRHHPATMKYGLLLCSFCCWTEGWMHSTTSNHRNCDDKSLRTMSLRRSSSSHNAISTSREHSEDVLILTTKTESSTTTSKSNTPSVLFWHNTSDPTVFHYYNTTLTGLTFRIRGNPLPLQRHRQTRRGFVYNPSLTAQTAFRQVLETQLMLETPLFDDTIPLHMSCRFYMKRSLSDFVAQTRGRPLKASRAATAVSPRTPDVDNLAKFVLDSFNGLLYADDQQIVSLSVKKFRDNEGDCWGYTDVHLSVVSDED